MGIFKSKSPSIGVPDIPIEQVQAMKGQGYTNNQIIQSLQRDGFTSSQIFDAISQSEMSNNIPNMGAPPMQMSPQLPQMQIPQNMPPTQQISPMQSSQQNMPSFNSSSQSSNEELIEAIIEEKWNELVKDINKVIEWKQKADTRLTSMEQQVADLKSQFDKVHQAVIGKVGEYDKHMTEVGAELQAMEKVFSKVLPNFIDNVNELNRITDKMKAAPASQKADNKQDRQEYQELKTPRSKKVFE